MRQVERRKKTRNVTIRGKTTTITKTRVNRSSSTMLKKRLNQNTKLLIIQGKRYPSHPQPQLQRFTLTKIFFELVLMEVHLNGNKFLVGH